MRLGKVQTVYKLLVRVFVTTNEFPDQIPVLRSLSPYDIGKVLTKFGDTSRASSLSSIEGRHSIAPECRLIH